MKTVLKLMMVCLIIGTVSCRDTKKEDAETEAAVEQIEAIEMEAEEISEEIDQEAKELEKELEELDKI